MALRPDLKVVLAAQPVEFRQSVHTLSALVGEALRANPRLRRRLRVPQQAHGQSEASGSTMVSGNEVAAPGTLHLTAIRDGVVI
jgi:transposase